MHMSFSARMNVNSNRAYEYIRTRILNGDFVPGHPLMTVALASKIKVSRSPVQEALRRLQVDGLVTVEPRQGASVRKIDIKGFQDLCEFRLAIESHAAGLAALRRSAVDLGEIQFALESMRTIADGLIASGDDDPPIDEQSRADVQFHHAIITASHNELIKQEILRLQLINRVVSHASTTTRNRPAVISSRAERIALNRQTMKSHAAIFDAITRKDSAKAKAAMEDHLQELIERKISALVRAESGLTADKMPNGELIYRE